MKYKTLTRIALRLMGAYFFLTGLASLGYSVTDWCYDGFWRHEPSRPLWYEVATSSPYVFIGLYLFFGGKWILNRIVPSNRPYCHECGYDLSHNGSPQCPECGVAVPVMTKEKP